MSPAAVTAGETALNLQKRGGVRAAEDAAGKAAKPDCAAPPLSGGPSISEKPATSSQPVTAPERATSSPSAPANPTKNIAWTYRTRRQKMDIVLPLAKIGLTAAQIAAQIGVSRGSIITIRAALQKSGEIPAAAATKGGRPQKSGNKPAHRKPSMALAHLSGLSGAARQRLDDFTVPQSRRLTLLQLTDQTCRWPQGDPLTEDFAFCGSATHAAPYCPYHSRLAFVPPAQRQQAGLRSAERMR